MCLCLAYHPVEPDQVFPIVVVVWHMVFRHFTQRVDVFPGFPAVLFCRCTAVKRPSDIDLADDPPHYLDPRWRREGGREVITGLITTNQSLNLFAESSII